MRRHLVFVTTELPPLPGGAGAVVAGLAAGLAGRGHRVTVLLVADGEAQAPPGAHLVAVAPAPDAIPQLGRSRAAAEALADLAAADGIDLVEFHDFDAPGFWALAHRTDLGLAGIRLAVRLHGPVDALIETLEAVPDDLLPVREMERATFAMADVVVAPSEAMAAWAVDRYDLDRERLVVGEPPVPAVALLSRSRAAAPLFVAFGRLGEMKGSHDLLRAGLDLMDSGRDLRLRFVGEDGWSTATQRPMSQWLAEMIPDRHRDRVEFTGRVERDLLPGVLADAWAVVVPSRFESFSLAAH